MYIPTGDARRAIRQAKRKQLETLAAEYRAEEQELLEKVQPRALGIPDAQMVQSMKVQIESLKLLNEAISLVDNVPSPNRPKNCAAFWIVLPEHLSVHPGVHFSARLPLGYDCHAVQGAPEQGWLGEILRGFLRVLFTGQF